MNVAYFSNQFAQAAGHGIARYSRHLWAAMSEVQGDHHVIPVAAWSDRDESSISDLREKTGVRLLPWGRRWTPLAWTYIGFPKLESWLNDIDVVHAVALGYPIATKKPFVVTVHDIGPLTHPEYFSASPPWIMKRALKQSIRDAKAFICVSQATADELVRYVKAQHHVDLTERVEVIHEGVEERFFDSPDDSSLSNLKIPEEPFLLTAGAISPRKNLQGVIASLAKLKDKIPHHLVTVGGKGWGVTELENLVEQNGLQDRVHLMGYVTDEQLRALYARASAYLHPSLFEGFGLTVLEAMASGCPVITSNVFSLPEIAGDAAILVNPSDENELADAIEKVCLDSNVSERLRKDGLVHARSFEWETAARKTVEVYRRVVG